MSNRPHLPPETLDYIVDLLHDEPETLERCCLVSKSWISRTRKHLFADIKFRSAQDVDSWKTAFPDPSNSSAYHTHTLFVCWTRVEADAWAGGLIQTFSHVVRLRLTRATFCDSLLVTPSIVKQFSLAPFHNLSPTLKSLHVYFVSLACPQILDLVRSSPLLEDLTLSGRDLSSGNDDTPREPQTVGPSPSPVFTGSLDLDIIEGIGNIAHRLLDLPNGLHFRKLTFWWVHGEDLRWMIELVRKCFGTLECFDVKCHPPCTLVLVLRWGNDLLCLQVAPIRLPSTSQKRQNSGVLFFGLDRSPSHGPSWHSEQFHPNIEVSNIFQFASLAPSLSSMPMPTSDGLLEKRSVGSGWTSTGFSLNSGRCV